MNPFGRDNESQEFVARDSQEGLCWDHFQLMSSYEIEHHPQVVKVVILVTAFDWDVVNITLHYLP